MAVELLDEVEEAPGPRLVYTAPAVDLEAEMQKARAEGYEQGVQAVIGEYQHKLAQRMPRAPLAVEMIPVLDKIALLVGLRAMLAASVIMSFVLALQAMSEPGILRLAVVALFGALTIGPLAWLATRRTG